MDHWEKSLSCATACHRCNTTLKPTDNRILSVIDHQAICLVCKKEEEQRSDYEAISRQTIGTCMAETEVMYGDPNGYCYHHFYPYTCT